MYLSDILTEFRLNFAKYYGLVNTDVPLTMPKQTSSKVPKLN